MKRGFSWLLLAGLNLKPALAFEPAGSAAFLKIPIGARAISMGSAYVGLADDIQAMHWNVAGLGQLKVGELGLNHSKLFQGIQHENVSFVHPSSLGAIGVGLGYLHDSGIEGRDERRRPTGGHAAGAMVVNLALVPRLRALSDRTAVGVNLKYIRSQLADVGAQAYAADLGLITKTPLTGLHLGTAVRNLGRGIRYLDSTYPLPLTISGGTSYRSPAGFTLAADLAMEPYDQRKTISVGVEYSLSHSILLRMGYLASVAARPSQGPGSPLSLDRLKGVGMGLGARGKRYGLDYAFLPYGELGNSHRASFGIRF